MLIPRPSGILAFFLGTVMLIPRPSGILAFFATAVFFLVVVAAAAPGFLRRAPLREASNPGLPLVPILPSKPNRSPRKVSSKPIF